MRAAIVAVIGLAACYAPDVPEGAPCSTSGACPAELICDQGTNTCVRPDAPCPDGFTRGEDGCVDIDECATAADDCSDDATCTNEPGSYACACHGGFAGDGRTCVRVCTHALIYSDCTPSNPKCTTMPTRFMDSAATGLGIQIINGLGDDQTALRAAVDAGGFEVILVEAPLQVMTPGTATKISDWVTGGGRAIVSYYALGSTSTGSAGATLQTALEVTTGANPWFNTHSIHRDPTTSLGLFDHLASVPSPLMTVDVFLNPGDDDLRLAAAGAIVAHHSSATGPGAIAVTRGGHTITLGFMPIGLMQSQIDRDGDGTHDLQELYANLIGHVCGY